MTEQSFCCLLYNRIRERLADSENPNSTFLAQRRIPPGWAQRDLIFGALQLQRVARGKFHLVAHRLWQDNSAGFTECQLSVHGNLQHLLVED
jgi:hypothetical protein